MNTVDNYFCQNNINFLYLSKIVIKVSMFPLSLRLPDAMLLDTCARWGGFGVWEKGCWVYPIHFRFKSYNSELITVQSITM